MTSLTKEQLAKLCDRYSILDVTNLGRDKAAANLFKNYKALLDGEKLPQWKSAHKEPKKRIEKKHEAIKSTHGAWSRVAGVEREVHGKDILQPTKEDGTINKHFVQAHGTAALEKEMKMSKREIHENVEKYG